MLCSHCKDSIVDEFYTVRYADRYDTNSAHRLDVGCFELLSRRGVIAKVVKIRSLPKKHMITDEGQDEGQSTDNGEEKDSEKDSE